MDDIQLTESGELYITSGLDLRTTDSVKQKIRIRLQWFLGEYRFHPEFGVDYYGTVFLKKPSETLVMSVLTDQILAVEGASDVEDMELVINPKTRRATIRFVVRLDSQERLEDEVEIWQSMV